MRRFPNVALRALERRRPKSEGHLPTFTHRVPGGRGDSYALVLRASIEVPQAGEYRFFTASDDGSRLYVGGRQIVDNDGQHGVVEKSGAVALPAGWHEIVVTYYDNGGADALRVSWQGPGFDKREVRPSMPRVDTEAELRAAAVEAVSHVPGHAAEKYADFARLIRAREQEGPAIRSMLRLPRDAWLAEDAGALAAELVEIAAATPVPLRDTPAYERTVELGQELAAALPEDRADALRAELSELKLLVIRIRAVPEQMVYDKKQFTVVAGKPVRIVFENPDNMMHNLLIVAPGSIREVGLLAEKMGEPGLDKHYRPDSDKILWATDLIDRGESVILDFVAPTEPGDYGYVCTFPGHWSIMNGTMRVVAPPTKVR